MNDKQSSPTLRMVVRELLKVNSIEDVLDAIKDELGMRIAKRRTTHTTFQRVSDALSLLTIAGRFLKEGED